MNTGLVAACNSRKSPEDPAPGKGSGSVSPHLLYAILLPQAAPAKAQTWVSDGHSHQRADRP